MERKGAEKSKGEDLWLVTCDLWEFPSPLLEKMPTVTQPLTLFAVYQTWSSATSLVSTNSRNVVLTRVLSSRWSPLWTLVPILEWDQNHTFVDIIPRSGLFHNAISNPRPLHTLRICCSTKGLPFYVGTWVCATITHSLLMLDLTVTKPMVELPYCLFFSKMLVSLSLIGNIFLNPSASRFPNIRIKRLLTLDIMDYVKDFSLGCHGSREA